VIALLEESLIDAFASSAGVIHGLGGCVGSLSRKNGPTKQVCYGNDGPFKHLYLLCCFDS
jgi:hypothetical protein